MMATYDPQGARPHLAEAIELARSVGDLTVLADARNAMAYTDINAGDLEEGVVALAEVLELTSADRESHHPLPCGRFTGVGGTDAGTPRSGVGGDGGGVADRP